MIATLQTDQQAVFVLQQEDNYQQTLADSLASIKQPIIWFVSATEQDLRSHGTGAPSQLEINQL
jgi:hypothetical protein